MSKGKRVKKKGLQHWQVMNILIAIYDIFAIAIAYFVALWIRFDFKFSEIDAVYLFSYLRFIPFYIVFCLIVFWLFKMYSSIWRFASYKELFNVALGSVITSIVHAIAITLIFIRMPMIYYIFGAFFQFFLLIAVRFSYRFVLMERRRLSTSKAYDNFIMLIGAGAAGRAILRDLNNSEAANERIICIIDDNENKWGRYIDGVPIVGGRESIPEMVEKYNIHKIFIAIPGLDAQNKKEILDYCKETDCEVKNLPGVSQLASGEVTVSAMKNVAVEDLLGRDAIKVNNDEIFEQLKDKVIMVTGGGGSIGSELCRQIAAHEPKHLIIFDVYENNAYDIQQELKTKYPGLNLSVLIGSVRDSRRLDQVFSENKPDIVFHAAAHKHVPLMEDSPNEAIKNNAIGTYKTAYGAALHGCKKFVLISTDKAVNPTNIMGASKRLCEMIIQTFDKMIKEGRADEILELHTHEDSSSNFEVKRLPKDTKLELVAVRFGNVLGSNGSVIPLFKKQIEAGGPVTVTHPDIIRYFMTIPEAVSLILQAESYANGGEIFVLDMGEPVKIDDLAKNLIRLSGFKPNVDIMIKYTGLRPGEKLYEEKLMDEEGIRTTPNKMIHIGMPLQFDSDGFLTNMKDLMDACYDDSKDIKTYVSKIVDTYHASNA